MSYVVVQSQISPPSLDQLQSALRGALSDESRFTPADAPGILNDGYGILMDQLRYDEAQALRRHLASAGYSAEVVDHDDLFSLPPSKGTNRMIPGDDGLVVFDVLGRESIVPWSAVLVIAAGYIGKAASKKTWEIVPGASDVYGGPVYMVNIESLTEFEPELHLLLEIDPLRLRVNGRRFHYGYLGGRMTNNAEVNFLTLVRDLVERAPHAVLTSGTESIVSSDDHVTVYPMNRCFEEELVWQVWRSMRG